MGMFQVWNLLFRHNSCRKKFANFFVGSWGPPLSFGVAKASPENQN